MDAKHFKILKNVITLMWPIVATIVTLLGAYEGFIMNNANQNSRIDSNLTKIIDLENKAFQIKVNYDDISKMKMSLLSLEDNLSATNSKLQKTTDYMEVLRKEVKAIAETKLDTREYWETIKYVRGGHNG